MQLITFIYLLAALLATGNAPPPAARTVSFAADIRPILERRCQPCHFTGGRMHASLPFDRSETITKLGTKLFTRIKAKEEQQVIRAFLQQQTP